jgi:hypothetical protein
LQKFYVADVVRGERLVSRLRGELAEGFQRLDGGHEEGLVARPLFAAEGRFAVVDFLFLGADAFGCLRALPAFHGLAVDRGTLGEGKDVALPGGRQAPAFLDLAEVPADDPRIEFEFGGDLARRVAAEVQALHVVTATARIVGGTIFFRAGFVHFLGE